MISDKPAAPGEAPIPCFFLPRLILHNMDDVVAKRPAFPGILADPWGA
jgi:hypothetical protein